LVINFMLTFQSWFYFRLWHLSIVLASSPLLKWPLLVVFLRQYFSLLANYNLQGKSSQSIAFVNKVLLEHSHTHSFIYALCEPVFVVYDRTVYLGHLFHDALSEITSLVIATWSAHWGLFSRGVF
jgi:hypothetical protein